MRIFCAHNLRGFVDGVTSYDCAAAGERARAPIELVGVARDDIDLIDIHAELFGDDLRETREVTLSLRANSRHDRDASTAHHLHLRAFIRTNARAFHIRDDTNANVFAFGAQLRLDLVDELVIVHSFERFIQQRLVVAAVIHQRGKVLIDDLVVVRELIWLNKIASADFGAVDLQFFRGKIKHPLDDKDAMLASCAAIRRDNGLVGEDRRELAVIIFDVIGSEQRALTVERHGQAIRRIRARVMQKDIMHTEDATVLVERDLRIMDLSALVRGGDEIFSTVFDPFDGAVQLHRRPRDEHFLLIEHHDLRTKSPADKRRDHPHLPLRKTKHARQSIANDNGSLGRIPDG